MADDTTPTQKTRPKKGDPVEIPVPPKTQIMSDFEKIVAADDTDSEVDRSGDR